LLFFIGIPILVALIVLLPQAKHGAIVMVILAFIAGSGVELARLFRQKGVAVNDAVAGAVSLAAPLCAYIGSLLEGTAIEGGSPLGSIGTLSLGCALAILAAFSPFAFVSKDRIDSVIPKATALGFIAVYPGMLGAFIVLIASEPPLATESLLSFCIITFGNDSLAWLAGMTIGRKRGIVAVSPNKSLAGFISGMAASIGLSLLIPLLFPGATAAHWSLLLVLGVAVGAADIVGDLFESALKRSAGIKDSGSIVPGRGGILDSFDSLLFAAPLFYGLCLALGLFR